MKSADNKELNYQFKTNINMKTKTSILAVTKAFFILLISGMCFISCEESKFPETTSKFLVERIEPNKTKGTSLYLVRPIEQKDLNMSKTWIVDSVGKFNAGDTLSFQHCR